MNDRLEVPKFASEEEEANWWFENRGKLEEEFLEAARSGQLRSGAASILHRAMETETPDHGVDRH